MTTAKPSLELWCVRHGEAKSNVKPPEENTVGSDAPLTKKGVRQAEAAGRYLKKLSTQGLTLPDVIWHSQFSRARQTAHIIADILGEDTEVEYRLQEIRKGAWEGKTVADIIPKEDHIPDSKKPYVRPPENKQSPPAENVLDVAARMAAFIQELEERKESPAILVSHNHPLEAMIGLLLNPDAPDDPNKWQVKSLENGSITHLFRRAGTWHIDSDIYNFVPKDSSQS